MPRPQIRWQRLLIVYSTIALVCFIAGLIAPPPLHAPLLSIGVLLIAAFLPLLMLIYFLQGLLRLH